MADRRSQSDESVILEYFSLQSIDKCDAMVNLIGDKLRERKRRSLIDKVRAAYPITTEDETEVPDA